MADEPESQLMTLTEEEVQRALGAAIAAKLGQAVRVRGYEVQWSVDLLHKHLQVEFAPEPTVTPAPPVDFSVDPTERLP